MAVFIFISPFAIGLLDFVLCCLSFSMSHISFIIYTADEQKQNEIKPKKDMKNDSENNLFPKTRGRNIKIFFM